MPTNTPAPVVEPQTHRAGLLCTGSMEPALTCLDEVTIRTDFAPADITVGTIIDFLSSPVDCPVREGIHRVVDVKVEDGVHYYWTKGDNAEADDCWLPESYVHGYVVDVHVGVRPENADLRESVNDSKARLDEARAKYREAAAAYDDYCLRWATGPDCELPDEHYAYGLGLWRVADALLWEWEIQDNSHRLLLWTARNK